MNSDKVISMKMVHAAASPNDLAGSSSAARRERETLAVSSFYDVRLADKLYTGSILPSLVRSHKVESHFLTDTESL